MFNKNCNFFANAAEGFGQDLGKAFVIVNSNEWERHSEVVLFTYSQMMEKLGRVELDDAVSIFGIIFF